MPPQSVNEQLILVNKFAITRQAVLLEAKTKKIDINEKLKGHELKLEQLKKQEGDTKAPL